MVEEAAAARRRGDRGGRDRRDAHGRQQRRPRRGGPGAALVWTSRSSPGTRRRAWRTSPPWRGSAGPKVAGRVRHRRRKLAVHVRPRRPGRGAVQRRRGRRPLHGAVRPRRAGVRGGAERGARAIAADLARLDGRPAPDALVAMGGAVTNLAAVKHGLAEYDADVVQGTVLDRAEIDRQIELYRAAAPTSVARSSACSPSALTSSSRVPASCARCSEARQGLADGQRSRPAPRRAHRAFRLVTGRSPMTA